jgi:hypothetical protein
MFFVVVFIELTEASFDNSDYTTMPVGGLGGNTH